PPGGLQEWQGRQPAGKAVAPPQHHFLADTRKPQRCERCGRERDAAADTARLQLFAHALAQVSCAAEEPQAATHFEQQAVRWLETDTRREGLESERCDGFEECLLTT